MESETQGLGKVLYKIARDDMCILNSLRLRLVSVKRMRLEGRSEVMMTCDT